MTNKLATQWALLDRHFEYHGRLIARFNDADPAAVVRMWESQTNEAGKPLSSFEREALIERHCSLFGVWPK